MCNILTKQSIVFFFADETNDGSKRIVRNFGKENDILIKTYSLTEAKNLYSSTVEKLSLSFGFSLPKPANYTICYLRWLNKILKAYLDFGKEM